MDIIISSANDPPICPDSSLSILLLLCLSYCYFLNGESIDTYTTFLYSGDTKRIVGNRYVMGQVTKKPVELFCSYAHQDEELRKELEQHLSGLMRQGYITAWHDRLILPGKNWEKEIDEHLNTAHIILFLISASFIASDYCYGIEMKRAMERYEAGEAQVIPILLRPTYWQVIPALSALQALPSGGISVAEWGSRDKAFVDVVKGIRQVIMAPSATDQVVAPVHALYAFSQKTEDPPKVFEDPWSKFGPMGEIIGLQVQNQQWERAESTARQIDGELQRAQALILLTRQLAEAQQWGRAEAIAHSLAYFYRDDAHIALIKALIAAQQWERAEALTRSLISEKNQADMFSELSRALLKAEHMERAMRMANEASVRQTRTTMSSPQTVPPQPTPQYRDSGQSQWLEQLPPPLIGSPQAQPPRRASSRSPVGWLVAALIILASATIGLLPRNPIVGLIIGAIAICGAIMLIFLRVRRR